MFYVVLLFAYVMSWLLTGTLRRYALKNSLLDIPNERSSHSLPTPRGGGAAIVLTFLVCLLLLAGLNQVELSALVGLLGAGILVAGIGFIDDHQHIAARWRLLVHFIAAGWVLFWFGGLPPLPVVGITLGIVWLSQLLALIYLVWLLNLYNFMDGIDGIASIEAITVCLGGVVLYWLVEPTGATWTQPALLLVAVAGFFYWNFPRAKIFMGDVGSGFIGMMLGILSIQAAWVAPELFWGWMILLGAFIIDASVTLVHRVVRGEKIAVAHRSHAYQYAARKLGSHKIVSLAFGGINIFILLPVAVLVALGRLEGVIGLLVVYTPLVVLALYFRAGARETSKILK